ncbi:hypothetical protein [Chryseobacterium daeguense]|uniref:hypothetical protein n=1 Tax=Chryseobacterium daeguense TaxID=412438 RepID=UPI000401434A|nr:hypothetical protein [Chryseobacterium daeguense]
MKKAILFGAMILGSYTFAQERGLPGGDKDVHGCRGSAGYTYSQLKNTCVRLFEQKIQLEEVSSDKSYTSGTAVIFSKNMKRAEIFIPDGNAKSIILERQGKSKVWKSGKHIKDTYVLTPYKKSYQIKKGNTVIFQ